MSMRAISEPMGTTHRAKVLWDSDWQEYRVKFWRDGVYQREADYCTSDKGDALSTAELWADRAM